MRPVPTPSSTTGAAGRERLVDVERDVLDDARAPRVVEPRDRVVGAHGFRATQTISSDVVVERLAAEPAVERLDLEAGDVDEAFPLGRVNHQARMTPMVSFLRRIRSMRLSEGRLRISCRRASRLALTPRSELGGEERAEREDVPREAASRPERRGDTLEEPPLVGPGRAGASASGTGQMTRSTGSASVQLAHVALAQLDAADPRPARARPRASPASGRCRSRASPSRARSGSRRGRCRPQARRSARAASRASETYHGTSSTMSAAQTSYSAAKAS